MNLCVREHPYFRGDYSADFVRQLSKVPNVCVISPEIDVHDILRESTAVIVNNNTTGYEALIHQKPVIAFSPSPYTNHSDVFHVENPHNADQKISQAVGHNVDEEKTLEFLTEMFKRSVSLSTSNKIHPADSSEAKTMGKEYAKAVNRLIEQS
jgi:CDP-glycerol glycerophosphotransferase (TagB/SpsB family)